MRVQLNRKGVALGLVVGLLGGAAGGALATSGGSKATTTTTPSATRQAVTDAFLKDVADRLGVDVSKLTAALKGAAVDQVNQAVKDGKLTQAQADAIIQRINSGDFGHMGAGFGFGPGFGMGGHMGFGVGGVDMMATAATYLGLTEAQLQAQLQAGKSLADVAKATSGKSVAGLEDALVAAATKAVNASTNLTSDQKAQIVANLKTMIDAMVTRTPGAGPMGQHMDGGRMMGGGMRSMWR
ncbi:MAG TPA: hypothetical protein VLN26_09225 [Gaiellaceae bacterium]|nr:hypothetical protein [Gaiellaceae bacterium]